MNARRINLNLAPLAMVFAALLVNAAPAHAGGFFVLWHTTKQASELTPIATIMADITGADGTFKGAWGAADPKAPNIEFGDRVTMFFGSAVRTTIRPGDNNGQRRDSDEFQAKFGPRCEWFRPAKDGRAPYRMSHTVDAGEFNDDHRLPLYDAKDGNSPATAMYGPGENICWENYKVGSNIKTVWLRIVNGARFATLYDSVGGSVVHHDDLMIAIQVVFVVYPRCAATTTAPVPTVPEPTQPRWEQPAPQAPMAPPAAPVLDGRCSVLDGNIRALNADLAKLRAETANAVNGLGENDQTLRGAINTIQSRLAAYGDELAKLRAETSKAFEGVAGARAALVANQTTIFSDIAAIKLAIAEITRFLGELKTWHNQVEARTTVPTDVKPAAPCAPWKVRYTGCKLVVTANVDGVVVKVYFGRDYKAVKPYTMVKDEEVCIDLTPSLRATVMTEDGETSRLYGPNGQIGR